MPAPAAAGGGCTLQAAIEEADRAAQGADVAMVRGVYADVDLVVTGDVRLNPGRSSIASIGGRITVAEGGALQLHQFYVTSQELSRLELIVSGILGLQRSTIGT